MFQTSMSTGNKMSKVITLFQMCSDVIKKVLTFFLLHSYLLGSDIFWISFSTEISIQEISYHYYIGSQIKLTSILI